MFPRSRAWHGNRCPPWWTRFRPELLPELDRLSDSFHLIYYDQRRRGRSAEDMQPEDVTLASDIPEKVRHYFHLDSVVLLGHSWGTVLAFEHALRYPWRESRMILMNPWPASTADYKQLRKEWLEKRAGDMDQRKAIAAPAAYIGDPEGPSPTIASISSRLWRGRITKRLIARLRSSFTKEGILKSRAVEAWLMNNTWSVPGYDLIRKIKNLKIATLVITGDHQFIPAATAEHITQAIPNARLVALTDCEFPQPRIPRCFSRTD